jgi:hypothetical protein
MGLSEKISHDLELIKEITENSMKKDRKESRTLKEGEEESIEKKSDFKKQKTLNNMKDFSDSNIKTFEDLPFYVAEQLKLRLAGYDDVATAAGIVLMPRYDAVVEVFGRSHRILVGGLDLPKETPITALIGRDILDLYKVCLNGKRKEIEVSDP